MYAIIDDETLHLCDDDVNAVFKNIYILLLLFFISGIPLSYFVLLYTSKDQMGTEALETNVVYMLCDDYTTKCW